MITISKLAHETFIIFDFDEEGDKAISSLILNKNELIKLADDINKIIKEEEYYNENTHFATTAENNWIEYSEVD